MTLSIDFISMSPGVVNSTPKAYVPKNLDKCSKVWLRVDRVRKSLEAPYSGPYEILERKAKYFVLKLPHGNKSVSIDRMKPAFVSTNAENGNNLDVSPSDMGSPGRVIDIPGTSTIEPPIVDNEPVCPTGRSISPNNVQPPEDNNVPNFSRFGRRVKFNCKADYCYY